MNRVLLGCLVLAFVPTVAWAQDPPPPKIQLLWPDGAPGALGTKPKDQPRVQVYRAPKTDAGPTPAIVICPGGGYGHLAMGHEGHDIARWLRSIGITGVILEYRHRGKGYGHPWPLRDVQRAIRTVRASAKEWNIHPAKIGVLGFSAGGHLASSASVHFDSGKPDDVDPVERVGCRPDFAVLCYAVLAFDEPFTHRGSQRNLLGKKPDPALVRKMSSEKQVGKDTPPTFLWHTTEDRGVPPENSVQYYLALRRHKVPCEMHIFAQGRHGLGLAKGKPAAAWSALCRRWLQSRGILSL